MGIEPSRRFRPEACEKCGVITNELKQAEIGGKWYYACPECRGFRPAETEKESRREKLRKMHSKDLPVSF
ncbi:MAG: hypothetical protein JSV63_04315 [Candidatus Aenigmatarchaeota archaeon]|nr:MAG: hypothetical protein JSV63_04315 [Candidatus Aenigmarchaeota archaeon]